MEETLRLPTEQFRKLYAIKLSLEKHLEYLKDDRVKQMAPIFLDDAEKYINEYNELTNEKV